MLKKQLNLSISPAHVAFEKANRSMPTMEMAKVLGVGLNVLYNNRSLIKRLELPLIPVNFFDIDSYSKNLITI